MSLDLEQLKAVFSALPDPIFILTESGCYAGVYGGEDPRFYHDGSGLVGKSLYDVLPTDKADWIMQQIADSLREGRLCTVEYGLAGNDVEGLEGAQGPSGEIWFEGRIYPLPFEVNGERAVVWTARNITQRHQLEEELRQLSEHDVLTGACNRRRLMIELEERFNEFRRYGEPISVLMLDLDHFKQINDRYGHAAGDEVLIGSVAACISQLRDVDIFARFGGEEFVALMPHTPLDNARQIAGRLRESVAQASYHFNGDEVHVTVSIGCSAFDKDDAHFESVLKRADDALYTAKDQGRNRVI